MRVIAGIAKGAKLKTSKGRMIRPTTDRVKEALFNIISQKVPNTRVLDLYAGCGSLGIEALSRGAKSAVFIDRSKVALRIITENLTKTNLLSKAQVLQNTAPEGIRQLATAGKIKQFDLIFLDPPFRINIIRLQAVLSSLVQSRLIKKKGLVVLEHSSEVEAPTIDGMKLELSRKYGDTTLSFYESKVIS